MIKIAFSPEELQVMLQCIFALNFEGKHVITVGSLASKIKTELDKIEGNPK